MAPEDWTGLPFARVYVTLARDHPALWADDHLLAWYVRLLVGAERYHPAPAPWPRDLPDGVEADLVGLGAIDSEGQGYTVHGLARIRAQGRSRGYAGGIARAQAAARDAGSGRWTSGNGNAGPTLVTDAGPDAGDRTLVHQRTSESHIQLGGGGDLPPVGPTTTDSVPTPRAMAASAKASAPVLPDEPPSVREDAYRAALRAHGPDDAACDDPEAHRLAHVHLAGVGWRCVTCERADSRSFRERVQAMGGQVPPSREVPDGRPF